MLDAAVRAAHHVITTEPCMYCFDNPCSDIEGCGCAQAFARAALRAALPAEPPDWFRTLAHWDWDGSKEWSAIRAHLLGEDA